MSSTSRGGWEPSLDMPIAEAAKISATSRNDQPLLVVDLIDASGDVRRVALTYDVGWVLMHGLVGFLHLASK